MLLKGEIPRLIDEWQIAPSLWDAVRFEVDKRQDFGQFILTGSSLQCNMNKILHSGTGRISSLKMRLMSLFESGESNGSISILNLFTNPVSIYGEKSLNLKDICFLICRGGGLCLLN